MFKEKVDAQTDALMDGRTTDTRWTTDHDINSPASGAKNLIFQFTMLSE